MLLVINYLQRCEPPVLPCLQKVGRGEGDEDLVAGYDAWYCKDPAEVARALDPGQNRESLGDLLKGFFKR